MITSVWNTEASCMMHIFEADGWKMVLQECGKHGAILLLEGRGLHSQYLGEITTSGKGLENFLEFMGRFEKGKK